VRVEVGSRDSVRVSSELTECDRDNWREKERRIVSVAVAVTDSERVMVADTTTDSEFSVRVGDALTNGDALPDEDVDAVMLIDRENAAVIDGDFDAFDKLFVWLGVAVEEILSVMVGLDEFVSVIWKREIEPLSVCECTSSRLTVAEVECVFEKLPEVVDDAWRSLDSL
jgi:hypothetical protein